MLPLLCVLLLAAPDCPPAAPESLAAAETVAPPLPPLSCFHRWLVDSELFDAREARHYFADAQYFLGDLFTLRDRVERLRFAPPVADAGLLPSRDTITELLAKNRLAYEVLQQQRDLLLTSRQRDHASEILRDLDFAYHVLDTARDATCDYYYVGVRREALKKLRDDLLGPDLYYRGVIVPPVGLDSLRRAN